MSKRELVFDAFDNKVTERVPVGFWFHYVPDKLNVDAPEVLEGNLSGHSRFFKEFEPDFIKIMSDGYFLYPNDTIYEVSEVNDLRKIQPVNPVEWIDKQVSLVRNLQKTFDGKIASFYNVFAPATYLKWQLALNGIAFGKLLDESPEIVRDALNKIALDVAKLAKAVISEGGADGIYLSLQNIQDSGITKEQYLKFIAPSELIVLEAANSVSDYNILHICGYEGATNDLTVYENYPAKVVNYASVVEGVPLSEGKKIFGGRAIIGGFDNTENGVLYRGTKEEIERETVRILDDAGTVGIILGADCTVPSDISFEHLNWVREAAREYSERKISIAV